jgi:hypothetical protein
MRAHWVRRRRRRNNNNNNNNEERETVQRQTLVNSVYVKVGNVVISVFWDVRPFKFGRQVPNVSEESAAFIFRAAEWNSNTVLPYGPPEFPSERGLPTKYPCALNL